MTLSPFAVLPRYPQSQQGSKASQPWAIVTGFGLFTILGSLIGVAPAQAQYESFVLNPADVPLQVTGSGQSGGSRWTDDCGHLDAANTPDHVVELTADFAQLQATVQAEAAVTLYIQSPNGSSICVSNPATNANASATHLTTSLAYQGAWSAGTYYLWIGDWDRGLHPYELVLSAEPPTDNPVLQVPPTPTTTNDVTTDVTPPDATTAEPAVLPTETPEAAATTPSPATPADDASPDPTEPEVKQLGTNDAIALGRLEMTVFEQTNQARTAQGRSPLTVSDPLTAAAQAHAEDLARRRTLSHTGGDGSSLSDRVEQVDYRYRRIGENVAFQGGYLDAVQVVEDWLDSPGHRANILQPDFTEIGIGYASNGDRHYFVQVFGRSQ